MLKSLVLRTLEFQEKIRILPHIVELKKPEVWTRNKDMIKDIAKSLHKVRQFRNLLAHSPLDTSKETSESLRNRPETSENGFHILEYQKGKVNKRKIDEGKIKSEVMRTEQLYFRLLQLWALLKNDSEDATACETLSNLDEDDQQRILSAYGLLSGE